MRVHSMNCVTMCPPGGRLMDGRRGARGPALLSCHCLVVELADRLVLVDTGFGTQDVRNPDRLSPVFRHVLCRPRLREEDTAVRQLEALGHRPGDVTDIVLTHLDFDHAGGLDDFPQARVHLMQAERDNAARQATWKQRGRFRPSQWSSMARWHTYQAGGEPWFGFDAVRQLDGLPPEILLVPLIGHTMGHAAVAVREPDRWLLHAGDAYFFRDEMNPDHPRCTPGLRMYQWLMEEDRKLRLENQRRLRELARDHAGEVRIFCAHDLVELEALVAEQRGAPVRAPAAVGVERPHGLVPQPG